MATLKKTVGAQWPLRASFEFDISASDQMVDTGGATSALGANGKVFDVIPLPYGAQVTNGELIVKTASDSAGAHTIDIGDSADDDRYTASPISLKSAARTALTLTGYVSLGEALRLTFVQASTAPTVGKAQVMVEFVISGRQNENLKTT